MNTFVCIAILACIASSALAQESTYFFFDNGNVRMVNNVTGAVTTATLDKPATPVTIVAATAGNGATATKLGYSNGVVWNNAIYALDNSKFVVVKIDPTTTPWTVTDFAGTSGTSGDNDATGTAALFTDLLGLVVAGDVLVVADRTVVAAAATGATKLKSITSAGVVTSIVNGVAGAADGVLATGGINGAFQDMVASSTGDIYVATAGRIQKVANTEEKPTEWTVSLVLAADAQNVFQGQAANAKFAADAKTMTNFIKMDISADDSTLWIVGTSAPDGAAPEAVQTVFVETAAKSAQIVKLTIATKAVEVVLEEDAITAAEALLDGDSTPASDPLGRLTRPTTVVMTAAGTLAFTEIGVKGSVVRVFDPVSKMITTVSGSLTGAEIVATDVAAAVVTSQKDGEKADAVYQLVNGGFNTNFVCGKFVAPGAEPVLDGASTCSGDVAGDLKLTTAGSKSTISEATTVSGDLESAADTTVEANAPLTVAGAFKQSGNATFVLNDVAVVVGSFAQAAESVLVMLVQKVTPGSIRSNGAVSLAGTFVARIAKGFVATPGQAFAIITAPTEGDITGVFKALNLVQLFTRRSALQTANCVTQMQNGNVVNAVPGVCTTAGDDDDEIPYIIGLAILLVALAIVCCIAICCFIAKQEDKENQPLFAAGRTQYSGSYSSSSYVDEFGAAPFAADYVYDYSY